MTTLTFTKAVLRVTLAMKPSILSKVEGEDMGLECRWENLQVYSSVVQSIVTAWMKYQSSLLW